MEERKSAAPSRDGLITFSILASAAVGYFLGREHQRMQTVAKVLAAIAEVFSPGVAGPTSDPTGIDPPAEPAKPILKILSVSTRVNESNDVWSRYAWIRTVRNNTAEPIVCNAKLRWLDSDGFEVDNDSEPGMHLPASSEKIFRGSDLIVAGPAKRVHNITANVTVR